MANLIAWHRTPATDLEATIAEFKAKLPVWWFSVAECQASCDESCAPTVESAHIKLSCKRCVYAQKHPPPGWGAEQRVKHSLWCVRRLHVWASNSGKCASGRIFRLAVTPYCPIAK